MWRLRKGAHPVLTDGGGAILNEHTGRWTYLTPTASAAVMLLLASNTEAQAVDRFAERYFLPPGQAAADVHAVAAALIDQGLAADRPEPARRTRCRGRS
ncbi:PqqD family peptide modification chaperone [Streptomyces sp. DH12]|uniref:PqqD family peptide modification chaperone n=1 Tax=Streptomyces sp. DH12 TaxID=2857010 RepID=UPI001E2AB7A7|nr:PqqD family peptide modification chaperone [Streptomyces sp. DH12]